MIELDGVQYNIATPQENAKSMLTYINEYCRNNDVRNSDGELIQIDENYANPLYEILHGFGYMASTIQQLLYGAACSLNVARSSNRQLLNIAEIAHVRRKQATKTTIPVIIYANLATEAGAVPCEITTALSVSLTVGNTSVVFHPAYNYTIPVGGSVSMVLIAETEGSYSIPAGLVTAFDTDPAGFRTIVSAASIPGQDIESFPELRTRIQERSTAGTQLDRAAYAITQLDGVSLCNIYFNYSTTEPVIIGGVTVGPRQALLLVQGYSDKIAETFYNYLSCLTAGSDYAGAISQDYTTKAGQVIPVYIVPPTVTYVYIKVYPATTMDDATAAKVRDTICTLASSFTIGQSLTSTIVINKIQSAFPELVIQGVELSLTNEAGTYSYKAVPQPQQLFGFKVGNILIEEAS